MDANVAGKKIVLVDDDAFLLNIYATRFAKSGLEVSQFADPALALEKFKGGLQPDILVLDVTMPGMSGIDLLQKLRAEKLVPESTAVVMLTNQSDSAEMEKAKAVGIDGYIIKATSIPAEVVEAVFAFYAKHKK